MLLIYQVFDYVIIRLHNATPCIYSKLKYLSSSLILKCYSQSLCCNKWYCND